MVEFSRTLPGGEQQLHRRRLAVPLMADHNIKVDLELGHHLPTCGEEHITEKAADTGPRSLTF